MTTGDILAVLAFGLFTAVVGTLLWLAVDRLGRPR